MKFPKVNGNVVLTVGTLVLGVAQLLVTNKKDAADRAIMKQEILEELANQLPKKD